MSTPAHLFLIAGPSGSGKSRLMHASGLPCLRLDDYYYDADHPGMPTTSLGITDWDDPLSWDAEAAMAGLTELIRTGHTDAPDYSISLSRRVGTHPVDLHGSSCLGAEGIFAIEFLQRCRDAGLATEAIFLDRPAALVYLLRLRRDLAGKRKPAHIAIRRGWALAKAQAGLRRRALAAGFTPMRMRAALARVAAIDAARRADSTPLAPGRTSNTATNSAA